MNLGASFKFDPSFHVLINRTMTDDRGVTIRVLFAWYSDGSSIWSVSNESFVRIPCVVQCPNGDIVYEDMERLVNFSGWKWTNK